MQHGGGRGGVAGRTDATAQEGLGTGRRGGRGAGNWQNPLCWAPTASSTPCSCAWPADAQEEPTAGSAFSYLTQFYIPGAVEGPVRAHGGPRPLAHLTGDRGKPPTLGLHSPDAREAPQHMRSAACMWRTLRQPACASESARSSSGPFDEQNFWRRLLCRSLCVLRVIVGTRIWHPRVVGGRVRHGRLRCCGVTSWAGGRGPTRHRRLENPHPQP